MTLWYGSPRRWLEFLERRDSGTGGGDVSKGRVAGRRPLDVMYRIVGARSGLRILANHTARPISAVCCPAADNASSVWRRSRDSTDRIFFRFMVRQAQRHSVSTFSRPT
jgi:hypothetical protein